MNPEFFLKKRKYNVFRGRERFLLVGQALLLPFFALPFPFSLLSLPSSSFIILPIPVPENYALLSLPFLPITFLPFLSLSFVELFTGSSPTLCSVSFRKNLKRGVVCEL